MLTAWEAAVLTTWPMGRLVRSQGLEPGTHWLRVSCSTNWAKSGDMGLRQLKVDNWKLKILFHNFQLSIFNFSFGLMYPENWTFNLLLCFICNTEPALWSSFRLISISQLHTLLRFHLWPIYDIVYVEPQWRSYLGESFTLRCLQRLSRPYIATQPCPWQNNWYTRGTSNPVLSY